MSFGTSLLSVIAPSANALIPDITAFLVHSTVLTAGALGAVWVLRRRSMAAQSLVLKTFLFLVLICPVLMLVLRNAGVELFRVPVPIEKMVPDMSDDPVPERIRAVLANPLVPNGDQADPLMLRLPETDQSTAHTSPAGQMQESVSPTVIPATLKTLSPEPDGPGIRTYVYSAVFIVWISASLYFLFRLLYGFAAIAIIRITARTAEIDVYREGIRLASLHKLPHPRLLKSRFVRTPFLAGIFSPVIILPEHGRVSGEIIAHELAHFIRGDCFWKLIGQLVHIIIPLQPLISFLNRRLEDISDYLCDDFVVENRYDPQTYAFALVTYAEYASSGYRDSNTVARLLSPRSGLRNRVERILSTTINRRLGIGKPAMFAVSAAGLALTATIAAVTFEATAINLPASLMNATDLVRLPADGEPVAVIAADDLGQSVEQAATEVEHETLTQTTEPVRVASMASGMTDSGRDEVPQSKTVQTDDVSEPTISTEDTASLLIAETASIPGDTIPSDDATIPELDDTGLVAALTMPVEETGSEYHETVQPDPVAIEPNHSEQPRSNAAQEESAPILTASVRTLRENLLPDDPPIDIEEYSSYDDCIEAGLAMFDDGRFFNALRLFKRAAGMKPGDPQANFHIGNTYLKTADLQKAQMFLGMAIAQKPDFDEAHLRLGDTIRNMGDLDGAWEQYKIAYDLNPALMKEKKNIF